VRFPPLAASVALQASAPRADVTRTSGDELRDGRLWNGFDYALQVGVADGIVQRCGHPAGMSERRRCCAASRLAGQRVDQIPGAERPRPPDGPIPASEP
jgi:hypothetical protein